MRQRQCFLSAIVGAWLLALVFIAMPLRMELAHSYQQWVRGAALPELTRTIALPLLRGGATAGMQGIFYVYWAIIFLLPAALLVRIWRARDVAGLLESWTYLGSAYAAFVVVTLMMIALGLAVPFFLL